MMFSMSSNIMVLYLRNMRGLNYGTTKNMHGEISATAQAYLDAVVKNPNGKLTPAWKNGYNAISDTYLGRNLKSLPTRGRSTRRRALRKSLDLTSMTTFL